MDLDAYQLQARRTDQIPLMTPNTDGVVAPLLGIAGEIGSLQAAYKKRMRDGDRYGCFNNDVAEELGDIMWYVSNLADKFGLNLSDIAQQNLKKVFDRWPPEDPVHRTEDDLFDHSAPEDQRLPRAFAVEFRSIENGDAIEPTTQAYWNGQPWGNELGDNAYMEDGYRFHDVMHLAHAAVMGWSPVARKMFDRKRKYDPIIDGVEDSGRAIVVEEGIVAYVYGHASRSAYFEGTHAIDWSTLKTIRSMTDGLEVSTRPDWEWERAILSGYGVWRQIRDAGSGTAVGDLYQRALRFEPTKWPGDSTSPTAETVIGSDADHGNSHFGG